MHSFATFMKNFWQSLWSSRNVVQLSETDVTFVKNFFENLKLSCEEIESEINALESAQGVRLELERNLLSEFMQKGELINNIAISEGKVNIVDATCAFGLFSRLRGYTKEDILQKQKLEFYLQSMLLVHQANEVNDFMRIEKSARFMIEVEEHNTRTDLVQCQKTEEAYIVEMFGGELSEIGNDDVDHLDVYLS